MRIADLEFAKESYICADDNDDGDCDFGGNHVQCSVEIQNASPGNIYMERNFIQDNVKFSPSRDFNAKDQGVAPISQSKVAQSTNYFKEFYKSMMIVIQALIMLACSMSSVLKWMV